MRLAILDRFASGDRAGAEEIRSQMVPFEDFRGERAGGYSASALHVAMDQAGLGGGPIVPFVEDVADEDLPRVQAMIAEIMQVEEELTAEVV